MDTQNPTPEFTLEAYVDRLIEEKQFPSDLEPEVMDQIRTDLFTQVENRIQGVIVSAMPEDKLPEFNELLEKEASEDEVRLFVSAAIPNLPERIGTELVVFQKTYLA